MAMEPLEDMYSFVCFFGISIQFTIDDFRFQNLAIYIFLSNNRIVTVAAATLFKRVFFLGTVARCL